MLRKKLKIDENFTKSTDKSMESEDCENQSSIQPQLTIKFEMIYWEKIWKVEQELSAELMKINYNHQNKLIAAIYNPLEYAADLHINFLKKFLKKSPEVLFLGELN